jgi:hypothetical protein
MPSFSRMHHLSIGVLKEKEELYLLFEKREDKMCVGPKGWSTQQPRARQCRAGRVFPERQSTERRMARGMEQEA